MRSLARLVESVAASRADHANSQIVRGPFAVAWLWSTIQTSTFWTAAPYPYAHISNGSHTETTLRSVLQGLNEAEPEPCLVHGEQWWLVDRAAALERGEERSES